MGILARVPLASGLLTGKLSAASSFARMTTAASTGMARALRWITMFEAVTCAIPGAKRAAQVEENVAAADLPPLSAGQMSQIQAIYDLRIRPLVHHYW